MSKTERMTQIKNLFQAIRNYPELEKQIANLQEENNSLKEEIKRINKTKQEQINKVNSYYKKLARQQAK